MQRPLNRNNDVTQKKFQTEYTRLWSAHMGSVRIFSPTILWLFACLVYTHMVNIRANDCEYFKVWLSLAHSYHVKHRPGISLSWSPMRYKELACRYIFFFKIFFVNAYCSKRYICTFWCCLKNLSHKDCIRNLINGF